MDEEGHESLDRREDFKWWFQGLARLNATFQSEPPIATVYCVPWNDPNHDPIWVTSLDKGQVLDTDNGNVVICQTAKSGSTPTSLPGELILWWRSRDPDDDWDWRCVGDM